MSLWKNLPAARTGQ